MDQQPQTQSEVPSVDGLSRRTLLTAAAASTIALALPGAARAPGASAGRSRPAIKPFSKPLPIPRVLTDADLTIPMREAEVSILPGRKTRMWTYDGSFPGPTIRRPTGERTRVRFEHRLPREAGELSIHLHGGHNRCTEDGHPGGLTATQPASLYCDIAPGLSDAESGNDLLIFPGGARTYHYDLMEDGAQERASMQWYHDHRLDRTARNIWRGLAGMWILDDDFEASLPLPRGSRDIPLMLADRSFDARNQLTKPYPERRPPNDGITGERILVNGAVLPHHRVRPLRYRIRVLNASQFRSYDLRLSGGLPMIQIATDAGLMPQPVRRSKILIGPGERAEFIVDFAAARGRSVRLLSGRRPGGPTSRGSVTFNGPLMEFGVLSRREPDRTSVPPALRPLPGWVAEAPPTPSHVWRVGIGGGLRPRWLINGRPFDPTYADVTAKVGETVTWELHNPTAVAHLLHLHQTDWYMLSRNGRRPPPWEACLKDTFFMDPRDRVVIAGRLSDHKGKFVMHCHMLDHEDHGLMSQFEVVA